MSHRIQSRFSKQVPDDKGVTNDDDGITIGLRFGPDIPQKYGRSIGYHHLLAQGRPERWSDETTHQNDNATRGRDDTAYGLVRIILSGRRACTQNDQTQGKHRYDKPCHSHLMLLYR